MFLRIKQDAQCITYTHTHTTEGPIFHRLSIKHRNAPVYDLRRKGMDLFGTLRTSLGHCLLLPALPS